MRRSKGSLLRVERIATAIRSVTAKGAYRPTALRSISLARVCQPGPVARRAERTASSRRRETARLVLPGGRPRRMMWLPIIRSAESNQASVSSGASSGLIEPVAISLLLTVVGLSHRDNVPAGAALGPDHHDHPFTQHANGDQSDFTIVLPVIHKLEFHAVEDGAGVGEIQPAFCQAYGALGLIPA